MDDFLDDILFEVKAPARAKFQPKAKPRPKKGQATSVLVNDSDENLLAEAREVEGSTVTGQSENHISEFSEDWDLNAGTSLEIKSPEDTQGQSTIAETPTPDACTTQMEEEMSTFPDVTFATTSPVRPCTAQTAHVHSAPSIGHGAGHNEETLVSDAGDIQIDLEQGTDDFSCGEAVDLTGKRAVKFQPKPKARSSGKKVSDQLSDTSKASPGNQHIEEGSIGAVDGEFYVETTTFQPDDMVSEDIDSWGAPKLPEEDVEADGNEYVFLDGGDDGIQNHNSSYTEVPDEPTTNREESIEEDFIADETSKKKREKKQKETAPVKDKPTRKKRKETKAPDDSTDKPPKKFPRATRRKRTVDKSLLEAPEDEVDYLRVPIRDLIILAEHRERKAKKDAVMEQPSSTNTRSNDTILEDQPYEDEGLYGSDQNTGSLDDPYVTAALKDASYYNYQSHSKRKQVRWSKQDTELFYQGIQQFGSDLSMIAELFPGRDRKQIKLKFKNEERQHPMRLNDALSSRTTDFSHFQLVIKRRQEERERDEERKREEEEQMSDEDNSINPTGEEKGPVDKEAPETNKIATKQEPNEDVLAANKEPNKAQIASPVKSYDSEDDFEWSTYQSEI